MVSINTDTLNILMQKNLNTAQNAVSQALERMSTGYKVNKAQDNAAGLYIATNMTSQIRGLKQALKNTQNGISYLNVGLGAFENMTTILNRLRDLSVQAANGIYDTDARNAMQKESDELVKQLEQILTSTNFNGQKIFNYPPGSSAARVSTYSGGGAEPLKNIQQAGFRIKNESFATTNSNPINTLAAADDTIDGSVEVQGNASQTVIIDGVEFLVKNKNAISQSFSYIKNKTTFYYAD